MLDKTTLNATAPDTAILGPLGNSCIRHMHFRHAGDCMDGHAHAVDHGTLITAGGIRLRQWRDTDAPQDREIVGPALVNIPAGTMHQLTALVDGTDCWCVFIVRDEDGGVANALPLSAF